MNTNHDNLHDKVRRLDEHYAWLVRLIVAGVLGYVAWSVTDTRSALIEIKSKLELYEMRMNWHRDRIDNIEDRERERDRK